MHDIVASLNEKVFASNRFCRQMILPEDVLHLFCDQVEEMANSKE